MSRNHKDLPPPVLTAYWCSTCHRWWEPGSTDGYPTGFHYKPRRVGGRCSRQPMEFIYRLTDPAFDRVDVEPPVGASG